MNPVSEDVKDMLESISSLDLTFQTDLFIGRMPNTPDNVVTIYDPPGFKPDLTLDNVRYDRPSFQIMVRNRSYLIAHNMINAIKEELHGLAHQTWNGTYYSLIKCSQDPFFLKYDEKNCAYWICNFDVQRR